MKEKVLGQASCRRMNQDSTSATSPMAMAVAAYCIAITLASWQNTYFPSHVFG